MKSSVDSFSAAQRRKSEFCAATRKYSAFGCSHFLHLLTKRLRFASFCFRRKSALTVLLFFFTFNLSSLPDAVLSSAFNGASRSLSSLVNASRKSENPGSQNTVLASFIIISMRAPAFRFGELVKQQYIRQRYRDTPVSFS